ncbi:hypothetical protein NE237_032019 [Protea cynaroides]|uniref:Uncharacterized protein n=1 Tax=Protea cynaroides TaxID=273540 RepID=A0A9Q0L2I0_9MAGN|nr:hypothetical protein NE237_032019 [Protea cynaroides]
MGVVAIVNGKPLWRRHWLFMAIVFVNISFLRRLKVKMSIDISMKREGLYLKCGTHLEKRIRKCRQGRALSKSTPAVTTIIQEVTIELSHLRQISSQRRWCRRTLFLQKSISQFPLFCYPWLGRDEG